MPSKARAAPLLGHLLLIATGCAALAEDLREYPEFDQLVGDGGHSGQPGYTQSEAEQRALEVNVCSICQAVTHQATVRLLELHANRSRGINTLDASTTLERLCGEGLKRGVGGLAGASSVWKREYGFTGAQQIGLLTGPGILMFDERQGRPGIGGEAERFAFRLAQACSDTVLGADLDEQELYEKVALKAAKGVEAARKPLLRLLCDGKGQPCGRYRKKYGDATKAKGKAKKDEV